MKKRISGDESAVIFKNVLYEKWNDDNGAEFFFPIEGIKEQEPVVRWTGGKLPWTSWITLCAYCELVSEKESSECQLQLFYHDKEKTFLPWAFPQKKKSGMVTKELNEHLDFIKQIHEIRSKGYYPFGTLHTHDKTAAFQSSVDHNDEKESEGLHITLGKISRTDSYDIHSRFTAKKPGEELEGGKVIPPSYFMLGVEWTDFIECPDSVIADRLPPFLRKKILETLFLRPDITGANEETIKLWMDNRIEEAPKPYFGPGSGTTEITPSGRGSHNWRRHYTQGSGAGNWKPKQKWLIEPTEKTSGSFPDYEGPAHSLPVTSGLMDAYSGVNPILDPDIDEDHFKRLITTGSYNLDGTKRAITDIERTIIIEELEEFAKEVELSTDTILAVLVGGYKVKENEELLKMLQSELEDLMEELQLKMYIHVGYSEIIDVLESMQTEDKIKEGTPKTRKEKRKDAIIKRKKLRHSIRE